MDAQAAALAVGALGLDADVGLGDGDGDWLFGSTSNGERTVVERAAPSPAIIRFVDVDEDRLGLLRLVVETRVGRVDEVESNFTDLTIALEADAGLEGVTGGNLDWVLDDLHGVVVWWWCFLRALIRLRILPQLNKHVSTSCLVFDGLPTAFVWEWRVFFGVS